MFSCCVIPVKLGRSNDVLTIVYGKQNGKAYIINLYNGIEHFTAHMDKLCI